MPKVKRSGYFLFMLDFKNREENSGRFPRGMNDVRELASHEWNKLPETIKNQYNAKAKTMDKVEVPSKSKKKSMGITLSNIDNERKKKEEKRRHTQKFIFGLVNNISIEELVQKYFYLIHVNYYCKTDAGIYYPAEIAISKFSLEEGVTKVYHEFIDPGVIKIGYSYEVKSHSEKTHRIPLHFDKAIKDHLKIFKDITNFLMENNDTCPPLFTMYDDIPLNTSFTAVEKTLKNLLEVQYHAGGNNDYIIWGNVFDVYPLPLLFYELKNLNVRGKSESFPDHSIAMLELQKDTYNFMSEIACDFHSHENNTIYCSKTYVSKWAYLIRDHCFKNFGISRNDVSTSYCGTEMSFGIKSSTLSSCVDDEIDKDNFEYDSDDSRETRSITCNSICQTETSGRISNESTSNKLNYPSPSKPNFTCPEKKKVHEIPEVTEDCFPPLPLRKSKNMYQFKKSNVTFKFV